MTQAHLILALTIAAGVLLPKMLPAALVRGKVTGRWLRFFDALPPATLASLTALIAVRHPGFTIRLDVVAGIALGVAIALVMRRASARAG